MNPLRGRVIRLSLKASVPGFFLGLTAAVTPAANALVVTQPGRWGLLEQLPGARAAPGTAPGSPAPSARGGSRRYRRHQEPQF